MLEIFEASFSLLFADKSADQDDVNTIASLFSFQQKNAKSNATTFQPASKKRFPLQTKREASIFPISPLTRQPTEMGVSYTFRTVKNFRTNHGPGANRSPNSHAPMPAI